MNTYTYTVAVEAESEDEARQVMAERIEVDEDYGFDYRVSWAENGLIAGGVHS